MCSFGLSKLKTNKKLKLLGFLNSMLRELFNFYMFLYRMVLNENNILVFLFEATTLWKKKKIKHVQSCRIKEQIKCFKINDEMKNVYLLLSFHKVTEV